MDDPFIHSSVDSINQSQISADFEWVEKRKGKRGRDRGDDIPTILVFHSFSNNDSNYCRRGICLDYYCYICVGDTADTFAANNQDRSSYCCQRTAVEVVVALQKPAFPQFIARRKYLDVIIVCVFCDIIVI